MELFELREKILRATTKGFKKLGSISAEKKSLDKVSVQDIDSKHQWEGDHDLEITAHALLDFIQKEVESTFIHGGSQQSFYNASKTRDGGIGTEKVNQNDITKSDFY